MRFWKTMMSVLTLACGVPLCTGSAQAQMCELQQLQKLTPEEGSAGDEFGFSVAIEGEMAVVGAVAADGLVTDSGSAYVFEKTAGFWTQTAQLSADDGASGDYFGSSAAVSGDTLVIGAKYDDPSGGDSGSVYIFERTGGIWAQTAKLSADDGGQDALFGHSVAISGGTVLIGAYRDDNDDGGGVLEDSGAAYFFEKVDGVWTQQDKLKAGDSGGYEHFGYSVALSPDAAVIGARGDTELGSWAGAAYVFEKVGDIWTQKAKLTASDAGNDEYFGYSAALSGDTAVIGARGANSAGAAYVFQNGANGLWDDGATDQVAKLFATQTDGGDQFACSVALAGDTAVMGAFWDDDLGDNSGAAYVFGNGANGVWDGGSADQTSNLVPTGGVAGDEFGLSVAISGDTVVIGAHFDDDFGGNSGAAYVFDLNDANDDGIPDECGACCFTGGCSQVIEATCETLGIYMGDETNCDQGACAGIPTLSEWGLVAMTLLVLTAGTVVFVRRRTLCVAG